MANNNQYQLLIRLSVHIDHYKIGMRTHLFSGFEAEMLLSFPTRSRSRGNEFVNCAYNVVHVMYY